jgi:hypothetical protein
MNISLAITGTKKKTKQRPLLAEQVRYGLNSRKSATTTRSNSSIGNVFGGEDDSSDDNGNNDDGDGPNRKKTGRALVNQQLVKEQAALRKRAEAVLANIEDHSIYDFDGSYDTSYHQSNGEDDSKRQKKEMMTTTTNRKQDDSSKGTDQDQRKSKYIGDLLKAAKVRQQERDAIFERKIVKEQNEEDNKEEYQGKEKFVTNAYKRKLEERKQWETQQEEKNRQEEENDVTKKPAGAAFASFYGNLNRTVSGGMEDRQAVEEQDESAKMGHDHDDDDDEDDDFDPRRGSSKGFLGDFERYSPPNVVDGTVTSEVPLIDTDRKKAAMEKLGQQNVPPMSSMREQRAKKVSEARIRYFQRKQAALE